MTLLDSIFDTLGLKSLFSDRALEQDRAMPETPRHPADPLVALVVDACDANHPDIQMNSSPLPREMFDLVQQRVTNIIESPKFNDEAWRELKKAARNLAFRSAWQGLVLMKDMHSLLVLPQRAGFRLECLGEITDFGTCKTSQALPEAEEARKFVRFMVSQSPSHAGLDLLLQKIDLIENPPTKDKLAPVVK